MPPAIVDDVVTVLAAPEFYMAIVGEVTTPSLDG
jgi:hypothetical protein